MVTKCTHPVVRLCSSLVLAICFTLKFTVKERAASLCSVNFFLLLKELLGQGWTDTGYIAGGFEFFKSMGAWSGITSQGLVDSKAVSSNACSREGLFMLIKHFEKLNLHVKPSVSLPRPPPPPPPPRHTPSPAFSLLSVLFFLYLISLMSVCMFFSFSLYLSFSLSSLSISLRIFL